MVTVYDMTMSAVYLSRLSISRLYSDYTVVITTTQTRRQTSFTFLSVLDRLPPPLMCCFFFSRAEECLFSLAASGGQRKTETHRLSSETLWTVVKSVVNQIAVTD